MSLRDGRSACELFLAKQVLRLRSRHFALLKPRISIRGYWERTISRFYALSSFHHPDAGTYGYATYGKSRAVYAFGSNLSAKRSYSTAHRHSADAPVFANTLCPLFYWHSLQPPRALGSIGYRPFRASTEFCTAPALYVPPIARLLCPAHTDLGCYSRSANTLQRLFSGTLVRTIIAELRCLANRFHEGGRG